MNSKTFRKLFFVFCLTVCLYQIYKICDIYFAYKTTTFVNYDKFSVISLPAVTICLDKYEVLRDEYRIQLNATALNSNNAFNNKFVSSYLQSYPVKKQFEMLLTYNDVFNTCYVLMPLRYDKNQSDMDP